MRLENLRHQHVSHRRAVALPGRVVLFRVAIVDAHGTVHQQGNGEQHRQQGWPGEAPVQQREQSHVLEDVTDVVRLADATPQLGHEQPASLERGQGFQICEGGKKILKFIK